MTTEEALFRADAISSGLLPDDFEEAPERLESSLAAAQSQLLSIRVELDIPLNTSILAGIRAIKGRSDAL